MSHRVRQTSSALWAYSRETQITLTAQLLAPVITLPLLPRITRGSDKKWRLIQLSALSIAVVCGPVVLELIGAFPGADHGARFPLLAVIGLAWVLLSIMTGVLGLSMIADVVDARAVDLGRREEGLVMATVSFVSKVASGMGVWIGGVVLTVIAFPGAGEWTPSTPP